MDAKSQQRYWKPWDRARYGKDKEMKVGIAYPGVRWMPCGKGEKRRILDNKVAYATFDPVREFRRHKEGLVASRFNTSGIDLRIGVPNFCGGYISNKFHTRSLDRALVCGL